MSEKLLKKWVENLDRTFRAQGRKAALLVNYCPDHPYIENLSNINLIFLSPNTTPVGPGVYSQS